MFRFATPGYLYLLLRLPLLAGLYVYAVRSRRRALERFADEAVLPGLMPEASPVRLRLKFVLLCLGLGFIILALARPQFGSKLREVTRQGVEIMLAVDVSNSMLAQDFEPSRLERTKFAIDRLAEKLHEDRIGLIVFAGTPTSSFRSLRTTLLRAISRAIFHPTWFRGRERPSVPR